MKKSWVKYLQFAAEDGVEINLFTFADHSDITLPPSTHHLLPHR